MYALKLQWTKKNEELADGWDEAHAENVKHAAALDKRAEALQLQADAQRESIEALDKRATALELLEVVVEQKMQRAHRIVRVSEFEIEEKDGKIKELQAKLDAYEKRAKPKKRKRQH